MSTIRRVPEFPDYTGRFSDDGAGMIGFGGCTLCGSHRQRRHAGVIELGENAVPFREGMVVLCMDCGAEVGALAGMVHPDAVARLESDLAAALDRAEVAERRLGLVADAEALLERLRDPESVPDPPSSKSKAKASANG